MSNKATRHYPSKVPVLDTRVSEIDCTQVEQEAWQALEKLAQWQREIVIARLAERVRQGREGRGGAA